MSMAIHDVEVELDGNKSTIKIKLHADYKNFKYSHEERYDLEHLHVKNPAWIANQLGSILQHGKGILAAEKQKYPMRCPGAGILPLFPAQAIEGTETDKSGDESNYAVMNIRGSNRGGVWRLGQRKNHVFCWKEFAGITGSAVELEDPQRTALMELYEELSLISLRRLLLPENIRDYAKVVDHLNVSLDRANKHYQFGLAFYHPGYQVTELVGDPNTTVMIILPTGETRTFKAIVGYDPWTNALDISFYATINLMINVSLDGLLSLAGIEDDDLDKEPYMEDVVVVKADLLKMAQPGEEVEVRHLISVHGPSNLVKTVPSHLFFTPSPTLKPIIAAMDGTYGFRSVLENAHQKAQEKLKSLKK